MRPALLVQLIKGGGTRRFPVAHFYFSEAYVVASLRDSWRKHN